MSGSSESFLPRPIVRTALTFTFVMYVGAAAIDLATHWVVTHPSPENISRGLRWLPPNALLSSIHGYRLLFRENDPEIPKAIDSFFRAVRLRHTDPGTWQGLSEAYSLLGDRDKSEAALRNEVALTPYAPKASWRLANLLLLRQRSEEALPFLRTAAASDPAFREVVYALAWKILDTPDEIIRHIVPESLDARIDYLKFLADRKKMAEAYAVWKLIRSNPDGRAVAAGYDFVDRLVTNTFGVLGGQVWDDLLARLDKRSLKPPGDHLTNGDFEADVTNFIVDWRVFPGDGYKAEADRQIRQNGARSFRVSFDGTANLDFAALSQIVPVQRERSYRLRGYLQTDRVPAGGAIRICAGSFMASEAESFLHCSDGVAGTEPWKHIEIDFRTGPNTEVVWVGPRRMPSRDVLDDKARGSFWIDNFSLREHAPPAAP